MSRATLTRDRIVEAARQLFDESGTAAVTTNHIAARAALSPGNLYYYFSNKEEIICELIDRCAKRMIESWQPARELAPQLAELEQLFEQRLLALEQYAGVARELLTLARHLPRVRERYAVLHQQRLAELEKLLQAWPEAQSARKLPPEELHELAEGAWLLGLAIVAGADLVGDSATRSPRHGAELIAAYVVAQLRMS